LSPLEEPAESDDGHSIDTCGRNSDTFTVTTSRPSIDSGRTESPSPPVTPVDPFFPPVVHVISPLSEEMETIVTLPELELPEESKKAHGDTATRAPSPYLARSEISSMPTPRTSTIPRSTPMARPPAPRSVSTPSPIPQSAIPRSPALLSAITHTPLQQPTSHNRSPSSRPVFPSAHIPIAYYHTPAPASGLKRLFKPRQSAPSAFASPLAGMNAGVSRMKKFVRPEKKAAGWGDSFLDM